MKKYQIIVIDPPWQVKKIQNKQRPNQVEMDYPMMSIEDIQKLPISSIADENSWCFLWTTQKYLWNSKEILEGWGFNHKLTMVWEKTYGRSAGMALYGFRWNAEFILVGTKGKKSKKKSAGTRYLQDADGMMAGRERVKGKGDGTGVRRVKKDFILVKKSKTARGHTRTIRKDYDPGQILGRY